MADWSNIRFEVNNTLVTLGDKAVFKFKLDGINTPSIRISEVLNIDDSSSLSRHYRVSRDGNRYSPWATFTKPETSTELDLPHLPGNMYVEVKYLLDSGEAELASVTVEYDADDIPQHSKEISIRDYNTSVGFANIKDESKLLDPSDTSRMKNIYNSVNRVMNGTHGKKARYWKVEEVPESGDAIFKEYSLHNVVADSEFNIVIPNNDIPLNDTLEFSTFDLGYRDLFEIHIHRDVFQEAFDDQFEQPEERDFLFLPVLNKMFEIESAMPIDQRPSESTYWRVFLKNYNQHGDMSFEGGDGLTDPEEEAITFTADEDFAAATEEGREASSPDQSFTGPDYLDPVREIASDGLEIERGEINNNYTIVANSYYNLDSVPVADEYAIKYRNKFPSADQFHFSAWIRTEELGRDLTLLASADSAISITLTAEGALKMTAGAEIMESAPGDLTGMENTWLGIVVEGENEGQLNFRIYAINNKNRTTELKQVHSDAVPFGDITPILHDTEFTLTGSPHNATNIRILTEMVGDDNHSNFLSKAVIEEGDEVIVADQASPADDKYYWNQ